jgi:hypothetical protein
LVAKRHLNIEDGFFLVTGVDIRYAVFRFQWRDSVFFNMRPDFGFMSLASDCGEQPINEVESVIRNRLLDYYREIEAIKRAIDAGELNPLNLYPLEWWKRFWLVRGFAMPSDLVASADCATPPYLDPNHPCYSRKLAQAIECWLSLFGDKGEAAHNRGYGD